MRNFTTNFIIAAIILELFSMAGAAAEMPENYLKRWDDPAVQKRIDDGIEKNRKGDAVLRVVDSNGRPVAGAKVKITQKTHEFLFGCNIFVLGQMKEKNRAYEEAFLKLFNFATVPFYWGGLEPEQGKPRFAEGSSYVWRRPPPDRIVAFGKKHGITLKGHPLLWHSINPKWMPKNPDELKRLYKERFRQLAERYAKDIPIWDVVNESMVCGKSYPLCSKKNKNNPEYVPWAFAEAHKVFGPENQLMINDITYFGWMPIDKNRYYKQCARLVNDGVGIEGIGLQFHFFKRKELDSFMSDGRCDPGNFLDICEQFAKFGLPLWITEITIGSAGKDGPQVQSRVARDMYRLWFSAPQMAGITWWNLGDGTAYGNEGVAGGGLADDNFKPKPAYKALDQLINHDWRTRLDAKSDTAGKVRFRGFYGKYAVEVTTEDAVKKFELDLSKDSRDPFTLTLQP